MSDRWKHARWAVSACAVLCLCFALFSHGQRGQLWKGVGGEVKQPMDNYLVIDGSRVNGRIALVGYDEAFHAKVSAVADDAAYFSVTPRGDYVYRGRAGEWHYGSVWQRDSAKKIAAPAGVIYAAPSPDRRAVLWCVKEGTTSTIVISELETGGQRRLISVEGVIRVPAWSPQSNRIAYYAGQPNVFQTDKFTLEVIDLAAGSKPRQIAPPSLPTGITADRTTPPRWSPDGEHILFLANYEGEDLIRSYAYVTRPDGSVLKRVEGGVWSADGARLLIVRRTQLPSGPLSLSTFDPFTGVVSDVQLPFALPTDAVAGQWRPDAGAFAFLTKEGELRVIDIAGKRDFKLAGFPQGANLLWAKGEARR